MESPDERICKAVKPEGNRCQNPAILKNEEGHSRCLDHFRWEQRLLSIARLRAPRGERTSRGAGPDTEESGGPFVWGYENTDVNT
jgi:hypothetical protein